MVKDNDSDNRYEKVMIKAIIELHEIFRPC